MESLLSNYASSEDENENEEAEQRATSPPSSKPIPSLPKPSPAFNSSPNFSFLPPPKASTSSSSSSLFSSVPPPKTSQLDPPKGSGPKPKRVVQFKPPIDPSLFKSSNLHDDDDDEIPTDKRPSRDSFSASKSQPFVLPPPKNSFGLAPSAGRRALVDTDTFTAATTTANSGNQDKEKVGYANYGGTGAALGVESVGSYEQSAGSGSAHSTSDWATGNAEYENYGYYSGDTADGSSSMAPYPNVGSEQYGNYGSSYPHYTGDWGDGSVMSSTLTQRFIEDVGRFKGKRGRNEVSAEIVEVKQDELMSNRPREDQAKLTGIAFGPAYQPVSSAKGKPSKLHKRKHQIGSLYFDMKQKETELTERRSRGLLTKAETQAKYGW